MTVGRGPGSNFNPTVQGRLLTAPLHGRGENA